MILDLYLKRYFFISIRYHNFNPNYIHERLKQLGNRYDVRILLVQVDVVSAEMHLIKFTQFLESGCMANSKIS